MFFIGNFGTFYILISYFVNVFEHDAANYILCWTFVALEN